jgi:hypothetical protein
VATVAFFGRYVFGPVLTGLDWNGNPSTQRAILFSNPHSNGLPMYPATYIWKVYQRNQVSGVGDNSRYYTTFFWGNNGTFVWGGGYTRSYYGAHPYPVTAPTGDGKWEISTNGTDAVTRDDASSPYVTNDVWYDQALVVQDIGGGTYRHKFYVDLPSTASANTITYDRASTPVEPPSPCLIWGQAPDNGSGQSWGGYSRWEEQNAIIRGVQVYNAALTEAQIQALSAFDTDASVLSYCTAQSITSLWYLNMNWKVSDITDKSGAGHNMSWLGATRPADWTA